MSEQPEALRLADELLAMFGPTEIDERAAAELRRLHQSEREGWRYAAELEQTRKELMEALQQIIDLPEDSRIHYKVARKAISKAEGKTK